MLEVKKHMKIRKDNLFVYCNEYRQKELRLDFSTSKLFIIVDFYRDNIPLFTREYEVGECGDVDVNKLIDDLNTRLANEFQS
jgi:hypothetical protein